MTKKLKFATVKQHYYEENGLKGEKIKDSRPASLLLNTSGLINANVLKRAKSDEPR